MEARRVVVAAGTLILGLACSVGAQSARPGPDEMIDNPPFANWAQFKPGTIVRQKEVVSMSDGRKLEQLITYKLVQKNKDRVVVESTVQDKTAGATESTRAVNTYPARIKMKDVSADTGPDAAVTEGKEEMTVKGKTLAVEWVQAITKNGDDVWTEKMWTAREIPGGIVKQTIVHKRGDTLVTESLLEMIDFKQGS
jgi:hypothetical protein